MAPTASSTTTARALAGRLRELALLLDDLDVATYRWTPASGVSGSIGAHVRHSLDHVDAAVHWQPGAVLSFDHRQRATIIEQDPSAASARLREAADWLDGTDVADAALAVSVRVTRDEAPVLASSSLAREFAFVLQHTIHHQAVIAVLLASRHVPVPMGFGVAPATPLPLT